MYLHLSLVNVYSVPSEVFITEGVHASLVWYTFVWAVQDSLPTSFSSAPPPAIKISTQWEIIVRVSSASDLPRPWQLLGGLSRLRPFPLSGASGLPSQGLWIPFWFCSVFVGHARVDVPTLYPALRDASRLAFCMVGNPPSSVNTRSLVSDYR